MPLEHVSKIVPTFESDLKTGRHKYDHEVEVLWTGNEPDKNGTFAVLRVPPRKVSRVKRSPHRFMIRNFQSWIDKRIKYATSGSHHRQGDASSAVFSSLVPNFRLDKYHPLDQVYRYLEIVSKDDDRVTVFDVGTSHEGRKIKGLEIVGDTSDNTLTWIDGCTHAREWITVSTALYIIEQAIMSRIKVNFVIVPVINPDGYVYTWTKDRLWRKNRRPARSDVPMTFPVNEACTGVDLNRNYDINFGGTGSSPNSCSHLYQGPEALSEPETRSVANLLWTIRRQTRMFVSLHSFNQLWASPFAFTSTKSKDHDLHMSVLRAIQEAVYKTNGVLYKIGPLGTSLYLGSGFAMDWAYYNAKITHSYLVELRDKGYHGFLLPEDQIIPTAMETWEGIKAGMLRVYSEEFNVEPSDPLRS